jgi:hypothetical protein
LNVPESVWVGSAFQRTHGRGSDSNDGCIRSASPRDRIDGRLGNDELFGMHPMRIEVIDADRLKRTEAHVQRDGGNLAPSHGELPEECVGHVQSRRRRCHGTVMSRVHGLVARGILNIVVTLYIRRKGYMAAGVNCGHHGLTRGREDGHFEQSVIFRSTEKPHNQTGQFCAIASGMDEYVGWKSKGATRLAKGAPHGSVRLLTGCDLDRSRIDASNEQDLDSAPRVAFVAEKARRNDSGIVDHNKGTGWYDLRQVRDCPMFFAVALSRDNQ